MDQRIACQLLIPCHFRQCALGRERVQQQDPRATRMDVLGIGCDKGTENDDTGSANLELSTRGVSSAVSPPGKH